MTSDEQAQFDSGVSLVDIIQARMDKQSAWILNGCVGPNPLAGLGPGTTYGEAVKQKIDPRFEFIRYRSDSQPTTILLARLDCGMVVGGVTGVDGSTWTAQFGVDASSAVSRSFTSSDHAKAWLKDRAREYCGREDVDFEARDGEPQIVVPRQPMSRVRM